MFFKSSAVYYIGKTLIFKGILIGRTGFAVGLSTLPRLERSIPVLASLALELLSQVLLPLAHESLLTQSFSKCTLTSVSII